MDLHQTFYDLHHREKPFVIANAWNAKSAQIIEKAGFDAIATSSGAIADSLGYKDGEQIPFDELLYIVKRIKAVTSIPLSVDIERGYTDNLGVLTRHIQSIIDAGAVGINLEDYQGQDIFLKKLQSISNYLEKTGQRLFINARTDVFLQKLPEPVETVIARAGLYQDAGANGLFVPGVQDIDQIKQIVSAVALPVNLVGVSSISSVALLAGCGVKRISMAGILYSAGYKKIDALVNTIKSENSLSALY
ncbi:isocitrate lyase/PEP mutase family protein [Dyadobacter sp. MSC1_007]|jgi:2-methylisocitrate lyase-like PEP mutase family enzyme|uniref:isocitrate lyase/PEP mutase family protein n=1 Tax=Dyadobacter sp. MSC1_007 TaxID=2909264 RepID=UPI00202ED9B1|nr:isocitrate lyase/phosphoenolpyruvate mutase family protein [Dyadobacter sp. MSC1_007]